MPLEQMALSAHARPQVPQLAGSVWRLRQAPPQFWWVNGQQIPPRSTVPRRQQRPFEQELPRGHPRPHRPQWALLVRVLTQVPPQQVEPVPRQQGRVALHRAPRAAQGLHPPLRQLVPGQHSSSTLHALP